MLADVGGFAASVRSAGSTGSAAAASGEGESSGPRDASNISSFSNVGADFDMKGDMNVLCAEKAKEEGELGSLKGQRDEAQSKIYACKQELTKDSSSTKVE